ncbi:phosphoribosylamine--glycine ligase [Ekhidna sp.]|jgi:phosphoribosylamine--glycine ligase|uniref:phosphoribosylamine--glycine ligase n=1 Tax=Ekhidna sp. TaxID=2608089 RepID=UPI0032EE7747
MNILILGSGGREHALAWKVKQSPKCGKIFIAPGNGGTHKVGTNLDLDPKNFDSVAEAIKENEIDLLIVGPEDPLVNGIVDHLRANKDFKKLRIIGPKAKGAMLEGSKEYAKEFMKKYDIPTADARTVTKDNLEETIKYMERLEPPYVLKADGLAGGKGVIITEELEEARKALRSLIEDKKFGAASEKVLLEQFLKGIEVSFFVITDGKDYRILPEAKDYKRIGEKDTGLNTGGMGAVSPVVFADRAFKEKVNKLIIKPTIDGLKKEKIDYCGFIFFGLINVGGDPYVIEYNVRMGDPETEVVLPRIKTDFLELLVAAADKNLIDTEIEYERFTASTVMYVSRGYPEFYEKGHEITVGDIRTVLPFHAGTVMKDGKLVTNGGRVIALTGLGKNLGEALSKSYAGGQEINWEGKRFRGDIGFDLKALGQ